MNNQWREYKLEDLLTYEQPAAYIVHSTDYNDAYKTPVLTAGKSFVIGHTNESTGIYNALPVIIFDDFTTATQYVNFPFKVKSSAMKILSANKKLVLTKFIFLRMQIIQIDCSTHKRYWIQQYSKIKVKIPPLPEQERIVAKIEELFSQLDAAVAELNTIKEKLQVYRQAVLKEAFEEGIEKYHYLSLSLKNLVVEKGGLRRGPFGGVIKKSCFVPSGYKVYEQGNAINDSVDYGKYFISREKYEEMQNFQVVPHDLIVSCSGTLGRIAEIPDNAPAGIINQALLRIRLNQNIVLNEYFVEYFRAAFFQRKIIAKSRGSAMQNLVSIKDFKEIKLNIPSTYVQKRLIESLSKKLSQCDIMVRFIDESLLRAAALRQSILKQAFIGDL